MERDALVRGVRDSLPILLGIVPFGLVSGVAATDAGLSVAQAMGLSVFVFAGASQLAALSLVKSGAPFLVAAATAVIVNLRMGMYSATLAPYFREYAARWRAIMSYLLVDQPSRSRSRPIGTPTSIAAGTTSASRRPSGRSGRSPPPSASSSARASRRRGG
nr:AzlC family ABC transporter permease [Halarchaeum acidiphilum]